MNEFVEAIEELAAEKSGNLAILLLDHRDKDLDFLTAINCFIKSCFHNHDMESFALLGKHYLQVVNDPGRQIPDRLSSAVEGLQEFFMNEKANIRFEYHSSEDLEQKYIEKLCNKVLGIILGLFEGFLDSQNAIAKKDEEDYERAFAQTLQTIFSKFMIKDDHVEKKNLPRFVNQFDQLAKRYFKSLQQLDASPSRKDVREHVSAEVIDLCLEMQSSSEVLAITFLWAYIHSKINDVPVKDIIKFLENY